VGGGARKVGKRLFRKLKRKVQGSKLDNEWKFTAKVSVHICKSWA